MPQGASHQVGRQPFRTVDWRNHDGRRWHARAGNRCNSRRAENTWLLWSMGRWKRTDEAAESLSRGHRVL